MLYLYCKEKDIRYYKEVNNMNEIVVERTWIVNGLEINKSYEKSYFTGKKIPNTVVYTVDEPDGDNLNAFSTLKEARAYAKEY